ncbi:hypothetical protein J4Q44_G00088120 [Coregonus suidteri]|uniref:Uncharacterized protein n=1 Tax=Coregonus suidteri TaxID=861788 RepID=A0AAN8MB33_9TELE
MVWQKQSRNVNVSRTAALHCLPALLCESDSEVFKICKERESRHPGVLIGPVCIFAIISDDEDAVSLQPHQVSIILEDRLQPRDVNTDRTVVLRCLPAILQEDDSGVFITCTEETSQDPAAIKRPAAIISVIDDD